MDPVLIMDDIIEKLHLLNYLTHFCKEKGRKPLSKTYFALKAENEPTELKVKYFVEICYWLMNMNQKNEGAMEVGGK